MAPRGAYPFAKIGMTRQITALVPALRDREPLEEIAEPFRCDAVLGHPAKSESVGFALEVP